MTGWDYDRTVHRTGQHTGAWPTDKQCPGETIREWLSWPAVWMLEGKNR